MEITVSYQQQTTADFRLNAIPIIYDFNLSSHLIYEGPPPPPEYYEIRARSHVFEPDGINDIDSVLLKNTEGDINFSMFYDPEFNIGDSLYYFLDLQEDMLPGSSYDSVKWDHFFCDVIDKSGTTRSSSILTIIRTLDSYPIPISPSNNQTVQDSTLILIWAPYEEQFFYSQTASIRTQGSEQLVWEQSDIPSTIDSVVVGNLFPVGAYFWRISVVDEYGNSAISNKEQFTIDY